ncbi:MAG: hypothetical protein LBT21_03920 [Oscillospiraceae bacterium]|nr:hypothetical protein [Oscillospiraceae bacterium]
MGNLIGFLRPPVSLTRKAHDENPGRTIAAQCHAAGRAALPKTKVSFPAAE